MANHATGNDVHPYSLSALFLIAYQKTIRYSIFIEYGLLSEAVGTTLEAANSEWIKFLSVTPPPTSLVLLIVEEKTPLVIPFL